MNEYLELEVIVEKPNISALHETVASIINQLNVTELNICTKIINDTDLNIEDEEALLRENGLLAETANIEPRFKTSIKSGNIFSRTYLYKAIHYLKQNEAAIVAPEYTFCRIEKYSLIAYIHNENLLAEATFNTVIDLQKISKSNHFSPRVKTIRDTAAVIKSSYLQPKTFIKKVKRSGLKTIPYGSLLNTSNIQLTAECKPNLPKNKACLSKKQAVLKKAKKLCGRSIALKNMLSVFEGEKRSIDYKDYIDHPYISETLRLELLNASNINFGLKGIMNMKFLNMTTSWASEIENKLNTINQITTQLSHNNYSYFMILPWIISGGIDLFAKNYLKTIASINKDKNILVILTNGHYQSFTKEQLDLPGNVEILDLPRFFRNDEQDLNQTPEIINSLVNLYQPKRFHIIASESGYRCLKRYGKDIRNISKIVFSSYNYITNEKGEYQGYTVQELPNTYMPGDIITTDNNNSKKLWVNHYNFKSDDILVHNQLFETHDTEKRNHKNVTKKILWAAHIRPEKNPEVVPVIAEKLKNDGIAIDCYGLFDPIHWKDGNNPLANAATNLKYRGEYKNFFEDINLNEYDAFLYTSLADGTPNVVIEAGLAGLPIVSSSIGGIPDLVGKSGYLVSNPNAVDEYVEAIQNIINDPKEALKNADSLKKRLEVKHGEKHFIEQVEEMLSRSSNEQ